MKQNPPLKFRDKIPLYRPPDAEEWTKQHCQPLRLGAFQERGWQHRAMVAVEMDATALSGEDAIHAHGLLDDLCDHVHAKLALPDTTHVWFDPKEQSFWAYPEKTESV